MYNYYRLRSTWSTHDCFPDFVSQNKLSTYRSTNTKQKAFTFFFTSQTGFPFKTIAGMVYLEIVCCNGHSKICLRLINGILNYTQGSHVREHMLEKCTPSSGRKSSSQCWPLSVCRRAHSIQPQESVIAVWDWAWNRLILFTCPEFQLNDNQTNTGRSARTKLHRL